MRLERYSSLQIKALHKFLVFMAWMLHSSWKLVGRVQYCTNIELGIRQVLIKSDG